MLAYTQTSLHGAALRPQLRTQPLTHRHIDDIGIRTKIVLNFYDFSIVEENRVAVDRGQY